MIKLKSIPLKKKLTVTANMNTIKFKNIHLYTAYTISAEYMIHFGKLCPNKRISIGKRG